RVLDTMRSILYLDHSEVLPEKRDELRAAINEIVAVLDEREPQLLHYGFYLDEAVTRMTVVAVHPDNASLELHMAVGGPEFRKFADLIRLRSIEVYGSITEHARELL